MKDMAKYPRLHRRGNRYYIRAKVPMDLQAHLGKQEIKYSLDTSDYREAVRRLGVESLKVDQELAEARRRVEAKPVGDLSETEMERLAAIVYHDQLQEDDKRRQGGMSRAAYEEYEELLHTLEPELRERLAQGNTKAIEGYTAELLADHGIALAQDSPAFHRLAVKLLETSVKANKAMRERLTGHVVPTPPAPARPATSTLVSPGDTSGSPTILQVFEMWSTEHKAGGGPQKTADDFGIQVRRFAELHGDMPVAEITKAHVRDFKDAMLRLPVRRGKRWDGLTVPQVLERTGDDPTLQRLSPRTVNDKCLGAIGAVLGWAEDNDYLPHNPASGVKVKGAKVTADPRLSYSINDLNMIFRFPIFTEDERPQAGAGEAAKWLPLLALFTGARLEELGQLTTDDLKEERGVRYLDLTSIEEGKRRKTESSKRRVPIHPELVRLGFLRYVEGIGEGRVFPDLVWSEEKWTGRWSKWWGRYARKHGLTDPRKVFHSFRHTIKDAFREAGVEEQVGDAITGHAPKTEGRKYGSSQYPLAQLAEGIKKVKYPGLDLSHLLPRSGG
jgi:integrase